MRGARNRDPRAWPSRREALRDVLRLRRGEAWYNWRRGEPAVLAVDTWQAVRGQLSPVEVAMRKMLRAAAHVHSDWSDDGAWSLDAIARSFRRRHYDVVLMCEHSRGLDGAPVRRLRRGLCGGQPVTGCCWSRGSSTRTRTTWSTSPSGVTCRSSAQLRTSASCLARWRRRTGSACSRILGDGRRGGGSSTAGPST